MILSIIWRPNCSGNGPWSLKKFCVPRAIPFKGDWSKLLKIKEAILNKWYMNWYACYLAISCCNKYSVFFVFTREPGQNVRFHKFGGPCNCNYMIQTSFNVFSVFSWLECIRQCRMNISVFRKVLHHIYRVFFQDIRSFKYRDQLTCSCSMMTFDLVHVQW